MLLSSSSALSVVCRKVCLAWCNSQPYKCRQIYNANYAWWGLHWMGKFKFYFALPFLQHFLCKRFPLISSEILFPHNYINSLNFKWKSYNRNCFINKSTIFSILKCAYRSSKSIINRFTQLIKINFSISFHHTHSNASITCYYPKKSLKRSLCIVRWILWWKVRK